MRAVSLVPSITETLRAWNHDPIACTRYCEQPDLPEVGGTKNPDIDAIATLAPDVVFLDRVENRREDAEALQAAGLRIVDISIERLSDVVPEMTVLANTLGLPTALAEACAPTLPPSGGEPVRAFVPIWRRPWMTIGANTYGSDLLAHLGVLNVFADASTDFPEVTLEEIALRRPDVVLAPSEPYEFSDEHLAAFDAVAPVKRVDGQDLFWWGARTPAACARLTSTLFV